MNILAFLAGLGCAVAFYELAGWAASRRRRLRLVTPRTGMDWTR